MVTALFGLTLFVSAFLLFMVQPLVGKLLLPLLGGTPAVWNTCLVFFQGLLLGGYLYAHLTTLRLGTLRQTRLHLVILLLPLVALAWGWYATGSPVPIVESLIPVDSDYPVGPLLLLLLLAVGSPFLVLATTGPLLQRWLVATEGVKRDPYVLYAASNAGSLLGLCAYPLLVEPTLSLTTQQLVWALGVVVYTGLVTVCAILTWRGGASPLSSQSLTPAETGEREPPLPTKRVVRWLALAALSSALLTAVTTHLTTDLAPMPLLWVIPLGLYLFSFILVFARWPMWLHRFIGRIMPMLLVFLVVVLTTRATEPLPLVVGVHLGVFFVVLLVCHGELALDRPTSEHLTAFYLYLSLGSVLGSLACALFAPILFQRLGVIEYPLLVIFAALLRPGEPLERPTRVDVLAVVLVGLLAGALVLGVPRVFGPPPPAGSPDAITDWPLRAGIMFGAPAVVAFALVRRPVRYALVLTALLLASALDPGPSGRALYTERNFFGTLRVTRSADGNFVRLVHGTTQHGQQNHANDPPTPLMYYHPTGPAGRVLGMLPLDKRQRVGLVGLGCGAMAAFARPNEEWIFYEIDPAVIRIAQNVRFFTYLDRCKGNYRIVPGDARRQLEREPDSSFDVLVLDAFSSDAIPVHLLTREAMAVYLRKLRPGGLLLFHVSNRYLDLPPLLERLARDHDPPLVARVDFNVPTRDQEEEGKMRSTWVLLARTKADLAPFRKDLNWQPIQKEDGPVWTDTFSNLIGVWKLPEERWSW